MESYARALWSLAAIAPGLSEAELRTALHLAVIADPISHTARASSRQIEAATRLARKNVVRALDSLDRRKLIATRQGGGQQPSTYLVNFLATTGLQSGVMVTPLAQPELPGVASQRHHQSSHGAPSIDIDVDADRSIIERTIPADTLTETLTARPQHFHASELDLVRRAAYKWLLLQTGQSNAQPPDPQVCARIAAAAGSAGQAKAFILDHQRDKQAETCEYLVTWILQARHGYSPQATAARRQQLREVGRRQLCGENQADRDHRALIRQEMPAAARPPWRGPDEHPADAEHLQNLKLTTDQLRATVDKMAARDRYGPHDAARRAEKPSEQIRRREKLAAYRRELARRDAASARDAAEAAATAETKANATAAAAAAKPAIPEPPARVAPPQAQTRTARTARADRPRANRPRTREATHLRKRNRRRVARELDPPSLEGPHLYPVGH
ncbi:MAG TPA: hypothetical protein VE959_16490 [Bryobacteraceae bacterium]|nr:hypothetical protein [Bryobacteraceae bacterium]